MSTKIEWTQETWNPFTGCTKISPACDNCYAEKFTKRLQAIPATALKYLNGFNPTFHHEELQKPLHWKKPRKIFVTSMGDMFHVRNSWEDIRKVIDITIQCPQHTFILLTKRAQVMHDFFMWLQCTGYKLPLQNVWLGVTAENQEYLEKRVPILLQIPAVIKFVSLEPLLGDILFEINREELTGNLLSFIHYPEHTGKGSFTGLDWVIAGGETGQHSRPLNPNWIVDVIRQCKTNKVPFFFKSWGDFKFQYKVKYSQKEQTGDGLEYTKVGKKNTGCKVGNDIFNEYPCQDKHVHSWQIQPIAAKAYAIESDIRKATQTVDPQVCYKTKQPCKYNCKGLCRDSY